MKLYSVANGRTKNIEEVSDEAFTQKMMGDGMAIMSCDGCVYAPADGEVTMLFPTHHAIGIKTALGIEILIHIGIDTVEMNGDGFVAFVKQGDKVKCGDLLIQFDLNKVIQAGYEPDIMVILTNTSQYQKMIKTTQDEIAVHDVLLEIE